MRRKRGGTHTHARALYLQRSIKQKSSEKIKACGDDSDTIMEIRSVDIKQDMNATIVSFVTPP